MPSTNKLSPSELASLDENALRDIQRSFRALGISTEVIEAEDPPGPDEDGQMRVFLAPKRAR